ncbi:CARDB domain-containing protein [Streptomyces sp. NPDC048370]|uniref:CARDB domain-containing protein n=1 Tax=Streptomyces sp. NPDC048370 TaxID=3365540 RepID=UPI003720E5C0
MPPRIRRCVGSLVALLLMLAGVTALGVTPAQAATEQITVSLYRVVELSCDEGPGEACGNDYYPKFEIDHQGLYDGKDDYCCAHGDDIRTNWVHRKTVDTTRSPVDIHIELWDQDDIGEDDIINWVRGQDDLDLKFDLDTCVFTGGGLTTQQGAGVPSLAGESETNGEDSARGYFTITTPSCLERTGRNDSDGDSITDAWETPGRGLDHNGDGRVDLPLGDAPYGALPYRKDLFVEVDHMGGNRPQRGAVDDVVQAFANAPVDPYPDPSAPARTLYRGINLHAMEDEAVPTVAEILFEGNGPGTQDDFNDLKNGNPVVQLPGACSGHLGTAADRSAANCVDILNAKRLLFRYMIFGESYAENPGSSGVAEWTDDGPQGGNDFMVTLGTWSANGIRNAGGRRNAEAGTFMHELGHVLSLGHGGDDTTNCKPNYLSVMNYNLQFANKDTSRPLDYTSAARGTALGIAPGTRLDESGLDENHGVHGTPAPARNTVYGVNGKFRVAPATNGPLDWNGTGGDRETGVVADINHISPSCPGTSPGELLDGFDDWAHIQYNPRLNVQFFGDGDRGELPEELTLTQVLAMSQKADLKIAKSADRTEAAGGDTVTYTTTVTDLGPGTATAVNVTDTLPDGTTQQRALPDLANGASTTVTPAFTYEVPCDIADGTVLTNRVTVTGTDTEGVPDPYTDDNTARATTTVRAPVLTVDKAGPATAAAGEALTYTLTYENTGSGAASGVTVTDTLPAGLHYSPELDSGSGPKPSTVTTNADGSRTLVWNVGDLPGRSGAQKIVFSARSSLLAPSGTAYTDTVSVSYGNAGGACVFTPVTASARTTVTAEPPTRNPLPYEFWQAHPRMWTAELLARVQATDQRYDTDRDGVLSVAEIRAAFAEDMPRGSELRKQLLATYLNLAERRINADTVISPKPAHDPVFGTVRAAALYAQETLALPADATDPPRYRDIVHVLLGINTNVIEVY